MSESESKVKLNNYKISNKIKKEVSGTHEESSTSNPINKLRCGGYKSKEDKNGAYEFESIYNYLVAPNIKTESGVELEDPWKYDPTVPPPTVKIIILSCLSSVHLGRKLNLEKIAEKCVNLRYNPNNFIPLMMYLKKPRTTAMIFESGNMIVNGAKTVEDSRLALRRFARQIQKLGYRVSVAGWQIHNITCSADLGFKIRMNQFSLDANLLLKGKVVFGQEVFSGMTIQMSSSKAKIVIFQTGRILITGVATKEEANEALNFIYPIARMHAK